MSFFAELQRGIVIRAAGLCLVGAWLLVWVALPEFLRKTGLAANWDQFGPPEQRRKDADGDYCCG